MELKKLLVNGKINRVKQDTSPEHIKPETQIIEMNFEKLLG